MHRLAKHPVYATLFLAAIVAAIAFLVSPAPAMRGVEQGNAEIVVFGFNDLGMHCMNEDFSEILILPPYNNLRAQVIKRGDGPDVMHGNDATVRFSIPSNTHSADKTNFWTHAQALFGVALPPDVGLTGTGLSGAMQPAPGRIWEATGIPITPIVDSGQLNPYPLSTIVATAEWGAQATTYAVVPVSSEMTCNYCHESPGMSTAGDILADHDKLHGTDLQNNTPVLCASCHADPALGAPGQPGIPAFSSAIHGAHASRMDMVKLDNVCYACHPGLRTQCHRDVHLTAGIDCIDCHGDMAAVGDPGRTPWVDEPTCGSCHSRPGFEFEPPGVLFKDATGHGGVHCAACHGSPHAIAPSPTAVDNLQAVLLQGHAGVINDCLVCHTQMPDEPFPHRGDDD